MEIVQQKIDLSKLSHEKLIEIINEKDRDIQELKVCVTDVIKLLGLFDNLTGTINKEALEGKKWIKPILLSLKDVGQLLIKSQMGFGGEEELAEKFAFIKNILPLIKKYA